MSLKIITGSTGTTHVTANNDGEFNQAIFGTGLVVLPNGNKMEPSIIDSNTIEIADGDLMMQGRHALIEPGTTERITIETGEVGKWRVDVIYVKYEMDVDTGYESISFNVFKNATGGSGSFPAPNVPIHIPTIDSGDIRRGDRIAQAALYEVHIDGIAIKEVWKMVNTSGVIVDTVIEAGKVKQDLDDLKTNLKTFKWQSHITTDMSNLIYSTSWGISGVTDDSIVEFFAKPDDTSKVFTFPEVLGYKIASNSVDVALGKVTDPCTLGIRIS